MGLHRAKPGYEYSAIASMLIESLPEYLTIAEYAITTPKSSGGCYGYPAATLLLSVISSLGSYLLSVKERKKQGNDFRILLNEEYFDLKPQLTVSQIEKIYKGYRCRLFHNSALHFGFALDIGSVHGVVYVENADGERPILYLRPLLDTTKQAVETFLTKDIAEIVKNSQPYDVSLMGKIH